MKPKTSPTSPKAKNEKEQDKELDNYYKSSLTNIEKPIKRRTPIWFLFVVIIFGFMAGILGQLVLLSYGSEIPYLDKLDIFSLTEERQPFFVSLNNNNSDNNQQVNKIIDTEKNSIIQIFKKNDNTEGLNSLYIPENQLGLGLAITNDGYFITTDQIITNENDEYVAITQNKEVYLINEIIKDPATNFLILKTDIKDFKASNMTDYSDIVNNEEVMVINKYGFNNDLQSQSVSIKDRTYHTVASSIDYFNSTEKLNELIELDSKDISENELVYNLEGQAIGLTGNQNNHVIVYPFYLISSKIASLLENDKIIRPYLGVTYINLTNLANISNDLSQGQDKGVLIYFDEEGEYPGIISNSPAEKAGLESEDIILSVNNEIINGHTSLSRIIQGFNAGDSITLKIYRDGEELEIKLTLESII